MTPSDNTKPKLLTNHQRHVQRFEERARREGEILRKRFTPQKGEVKSW